MKLPRGVSGERLIRTLQTLGYHILRQKGSHVRLRHDGPPPHSISVPRHDSLKVGTLRGILIEVAERRSVAIEALIDLL